MTGGRRLAAACLAVAMLVACGDPDSGVSRSAGDQLDLQVEAVRIAAGQADRTAAAEQLAALLASVADLQAKGELSDAAAARIRRAAAAVSSRLSELPAPTTTTTTTTAPPQEDTGKGKDEDGKGKGNGNGNGNGGGDGGKD